MTAPRNAQDSARGRFYTWRSENYWSVTNIINGGLPKPALINWAKKFTAEYACDNYPALGEILKVDREGAVDWLKNAAFRDRDKKAELGSSVHAAAEAFQLGKPMPEWPLPIKPYMIQFEAFLREYQPRILMAEASVYNRTESYAGTLDAIGHFDWRTLLFDVKTGKNVYPEVGLQLAAYRYAEFIGLPDGSERKMVPVDGCAVLHLTPEGYDFREVRTDEDVYRAFLYVRETYRFLTDMSKHVLGPTIAPPQDAAAVSANSDAAPNTVAAVPSEPGPEADRGVQSSTPSERSVQGDEALSGSEQTAMFVPGPRTLEQDEIEGRDIFGEKA